jgi:hypothetical protein
MRLGKKEGLMKIWKTWIVALALAGGCSSSPAKKGPEQAAPDASSPAQAQAKPKSEDSIVVKKTDRSKTEATYLDRSSSQNVSIDVKNADLKTVVLPIFKAQAGVWIEYNGKLPVKVAQLTLRDLYYGDALSWLCRLTHMHLVRVEGSRSLEIKEGYEDPARVLDGWRPDRPNGPTQPARFGVDPGADQPPPEPGSTQASSGAAPAGSSGMDNPGADVNNSRGAEQIDTLRRTVSTTNSGGR